MRKKCALQTIKGIKTFCTVVINFFWSICLYLCILNGLKKIATLLWHVYNIKLFRPYKILYYSIILNRFNQTIYELFQFHTLQYHSTVFNMLLPMQNGYCDLFENCCVESKFQYTKTWKRVAWFGLLISISRYNEQEKGYTNMLVVTDYL